MKVSRPLDAFELRVLGSLLEKERTTPEQYPLSVNALQLACNQKTAREPVMDLSEGAVHGALRELAREGLVERVEGARVTRWRHRLDVRWSIDPAAKAILCLLLLRGAQTTGEIRNRSDRLHDFQSVGEVEASLAQMAEEPSPLVKLQPRQPGQKEARWAHLLGQNSEARPESEAVRRYGNDEGEEIAARVSDLNRRVSELERLVALLSQGSHERKEL